MMKVISNIRSFHSSVLHFFELKHSFNTEQLHSPSGIVEPIKTITECGPPIFSWCAGCKVKVDTMRVNMTFLWMSDFPLFSTDDSYCVALV